LSLKMRSWEQFWQRRFSSRPFMMRSSLNENPCRLMIYKLIAAEGGTVLDAGCGEGRDYPQFVELDLEYVGIDITPSFIEKFRRRHPSANARVASVLKLPFRDRRFTSVYSGGVIQHLHIEDYPVALREMWRVTESLMIVTVNPLEAEDQIRLSGSNFYDNLFGRRKFTDIILKLPGLKSVQFKDYIQFRRQPPMTGVIIRKTGLLDKRNTG